MVIAIFGESCTGKSTLADGLAVQIKAKVYTGKDYLRLARSESEAERAFREMMCDALTGEHIIYVISERQHMELLPHGAVRVLVTAPLQTIKERFAARMGGNLPGPVEQMLERKHGCFEAESFDLRCNSVQDDVNVTCEKIKELL